MLDLKLEERLLSTAHPKLLYQTVRMAASAHQVNWKNNSVSSDTTLGSKSPSSWLATPPDHSLPLLSQSWFPPHNIAGSAYPHLSLKKISNSTCLVTRPRQLHVPLQTSTAADAIGESIRPLRDGGNATFAVLKTKSAKVREKAVLINDAPELISMYTEQTFGAVGSGSSRRPRSLHGRIMRSTAPLKASGSQRVVLGCSHWLGDQRPKTAPLPALNVRDGPGRCDSWEQCLRGFIAISSVRS